MRQKFPKTNCENVMQGDKFKSMTTYYDGSAY